LVAGSERPVRVEHVLARRVDSALVILDPESGQHYQLNDVGTQVWELCSGRLTIDEIVEILERRYAVARTVLREDVGALVDALAEQGLVLLV
jgi:hypothetical protein